MLIIESKFVSPESELCDITLSGKLLFRGDAQEQVRYMQGFLEAARLCQYEVRSIKYTRNGELSSDTTYLTKPDKYGHTHYSNIREDAQA